MLKKALVINASDLSQLSHFFESIVRIDLVYIIDAFILGDYSLLRQTSAIKQQAGNAAQTSQYHSTTMYQSMFNVMNAVVNLWSTKLLPVYYKPIHAEMQQL
jgi:hypothetical protein